MVLGDRRQQTHSVLITELATCKSRIHLISQLAAACICDLQHDTSDFSIRTTAWSEQWVRNYFKTALTTNLIQDCTGKRRIVSRVYTPIATAPTVGPLEYINKTAVLATRPMFVDGFGWLPPSLGAPKQAPQYIHGNPNTARFHRWYQASVLSVCCPQENKYLGRLSAALFHPHTSLFMFVRVLCTRLL